MSHIETVDVTLKLPKVIVDFLKKMCDAQCMQDSYSTLEEYLANSIVGVVYADIDGGYFAPDTVTLISSNNLAEAFKEYGVLPKNEQESLEKLGVL